MFTKLVTLGKDAELKSASGKPFLSVSCVYDVGFGQNKKAQWLNLVMFGNQAEKSAQHLTKGKQIVVNVTDLHIEDYNGKSYLKGTIQGFEFVRGGGQQDKHNEDKSNGYQPQRQQQNNNIDDDLPF